MPNTTVAHRRSTLSMHMRPTSTTRATVMPVPHAAPKACHHDPSLLCPNRCAHAGKVMNRAARIGTAAKSGQVWTSESAWEAAQSDINAGVHRLSPCGSLGQNVSGSIAALGFESGMHCAKPQSMARAATLAAAAGAAASSSGSVSASSVGVPTVEVHIQGLEQEVVEEQAAKKVREVMAAPLGPFKLKGISVGLGCLGVCCA